MDITGRSRDIDTPWQPGLPMNKVTGRGDRKSSTRRSKPSRQGLADPTRRRSLSTGKEISWSWNETGRNVTLRISPAHKMYCRIVMCTS